MLAKQVLYTGATPPVYFWSGYFGDGGLTNSLPRVALNHDPPDLSLPSS
jgi:hypothetical protein